MHAPRLRLRAFCPVRATNVHACMGIIVHLEHARTCMHMLMHMHMHNMNMNMNMHMDMSHVHAMHMHMFMSMLCTRVGECLRAPFRR